MSLNMWYTLKEMLPILLCQPMTSEANVGGMVVEVEPSTSITLHFVAV